MISENTFRRWSDEGLIIRALDMEWTKTRQGRNRSNSGSFFLHHLLRCGLIVLSSSSDQDR